MSHARLTELNANAHTPWVIENGYLSKTFAFKNFGVAFAFMAQLAVLYEKLDHHPTTTLRYNHVDIQSNTHDAGGKVTEKDFDLAEQIEKVANPS